MNKLYSKSFLTLLSLCVFAGPVQAAKPLWESSINPGAGTTTKVCQAGNMNQCYRVDISGGEVTIKSNTAKSHNLELEIPEGYKISGCDSIQGNKCYFKIGPKQSVTFTVIAPDSVETSPLGQIQEDAAQQALEDSILEQQTNTIVNTIDSTSPVSVPNCVYDSGGNVLYCH